jgi:acetyl-CoA synthetase (ADP-forming)
LKPSPRDIVEEALREGRRKLLEHEAYMLLEHYGLPVPRYALARSLEEALEAASHVGYPVVLKIVSPDIVHKSDVGGVVVGLRSEDEVAEAFARILENVKKRAPEARVYGVLVQHMVPEGVEVIVGATRDPIFGAVVMFGLGGIFVEVLKDVSFRVVPLTEDDAEEMIREIKGYAVLKGVRGIARRDIAALKRIIMGVAKIMEELPEVRELDLNPVMSYPEGEGAAIADARIIVARPGEELEEHG